MDCPPAPDPVTSGAGGDELRILVERAGQGDTAAFAGLVAQFEKRTFHFVLGMVRNSHDAEDITQETFVKVWYSLRRYRPRNSFSSWLFTIARRTALNHIRSRRPTEELKDQEIRVDENPGDNVEEREEAATIWATALRLPPDQYEALHLCYAGGFAVKEVAEIMHTNSIRVRVLLHRARRRMASWLRPESLSSETPTASPRNEM